MACNQEGEKSTVHDFITLIFYVFRRAIPFALIGLAAGAAILILLNRKHRREGVPFPKGQAAAVLLLLCYLGGLAAVTFMNRMDGTKMVVQLRPFLAFFEAWNSFTLQVWLNPLLNVAMFFPLGALLPLAAKPFQRWYWMLATGMGTSLVIEMFQYILGRGQADVDDLICNTLGTMLGYCLCMLSVSLAGRKIALIAAAICLTLMGTAFAINSFFGLTVKIVPEESGTVYEINWSITKFSLDMFSDQLLQASEKRGTQAVVTKQFDTWLDTQNFLGSSFVCTWPEIKGWTAPYYMYLYHTEYDCLWGVQVESIDIGLQASISMELYTENFWQDESITSSRGFTDKSVLERLDPYPMSNGTTAEILKVTGLLPSVPNPDTDDAAAVDPSAGQPETRNSTTYVGNFVKDGIL